LQRTRQNARRKAEALLLTGNIRASRKTAYMESHPAKVALIIIGGRHPREVPIFSYFFLRVDGLLASDILYGR
jgi:hypothetical protein